MFIDRTDAGQKLAHKLLSGHFTADIIVGLVHGGVVLSFELSKILHVPHTALLVKKVGSPGNPELAIGANVPEGQKITVRDKTVIVTDDGAATGYTMIAAVDWVKKHGAKEIIVALPVAPPEVITKLQGVARDIVVLETVANFGAVGEFYKNFPQLTDADVLKLLI